MYSKLLNGTLSVSCKKFKLQSSNYVVTLKKQFSTVYRNQKHNLPVCYAYKFNNVSSPNLFVRYQSTQTDSKVDDIINTSTNIVDDSKTESFVDVNVTSTPGADVNELINASTPKATSEWVDSAGEVVSIPDVPVPIEIVEALSANGEPTFVSLGLCNYTPVGLIQYCFEFLHVSCNMPWWATIMLSTAVLRTLMFPLVIKTQKNAALMSEHMPKIQYLTEKMTEARRANDVYEASLYGNELMNYTKKNKFNPLKSMLMPVVQAPVFISMFWGLKSMAKTVESMKQGGVLWFSDLSTYDPYYLLPVLTATTLFATIEIGSDSVSAKYMSKFTKNALRAMPVIILPFTLHFEGAILIYWVSNNIISLGQVSLLKIPKARTYFGIPEKKVNPEMEQIQREKKKKGFKQGFRETIDNYKIAKEMRERENFNAMQFRQAGKGPLVRTFDYNPKQASSDKATILTKSREN